jgi:hypothetical protein
MNINVTRLILLRIMLMIGSGFYVIGGIAHFYGLTLFPWYTASLYSPYHDTVIALTAFVLAIILFTISKNPVKNIDTLNAMIIGGILAILFSFYIIFNIDFSEPTLLKKTETIVELILLIFYVASLIFLKPKST